MPNVGPLFAPDVACQSLQLYGFTPWFRPTPQPVPNALKVWVSWMQRIRALGRVP